MARFDDNSRRDGVALSLDKVLLKPTKYGRCDPGWGSRAFLIRDPSGREAATGGRVSKYGRYVCCPVLPPKGSSDTAS
jgi:hypothetical protein